MAKGRSYQLREVCDITGISSWRVRNWLNYGVLIPSVARANGSGTRNIFNDLDIHKLRIINGFAELGCDLRHRRIREAIRDEVDVARYFAENDRLLND